MQQKRRGCSLALLRDRVCDKTQGSNEVVIVRSNGRRQTWDRVSILCWELWAKTGGC